MTVPSSRSPSAPVLVVGGGVSGCAAAAVLAQGGSRVLLVSAALDVLGLPGYGPVVVVPEASSGDGPVAPACLPAWYRAAWTDGALCPTGRPDLMVVDRRQVSLAVTWLLESHPAVDVRQGLVTSIRPRAVSASPRSGRAPVSKSEGGASRPGVDVAADARLEVESVFGESFAARAVILAVGTALGGRLRMGDEEMVGGRLGEVAADALGERLAGLGVRLARHTVAVGARVTLTGDFIQLARKVRGELLTLAACVPSAAEDRERPGYVPLRPPGLPPTPESGVASPHHAVVLAGVQTGREAPAGADPPGLWPDGRATGEWYVSPGLELGGLDGEVRVTRPPHTVTAGMVQDLGPTGALPQLPGLWVAGTAAGAVGYQASLQSGAGVARAVLADLKARDGG